MAGDCKVILSAMPGPYLNHGETVVAACISKKTHYLDVTGEDAFVHYMVKKYHERAKEAGVMIVHMVGQVGSPNDFSCYKLVRKLGPLKQYHEYAFQNHWSTPDYMASKMEYLNSMDRELIEVMKDPFNCCRRQRSSIREEDEDCSSIKADKFYPSVWLQPSEGGRQASRLIRRTCELFEETPSLRLNYGQDISIFIRDGSQNYLFATWGFRKLALNPSYPKADLKRNLEKLVKMETGVRRVESEAETCGCEAYALAESETGKWAYVHYTGPEPREVTAITSVASVLTIFEDAEDLKHRVGVLTPAYAFHGSTWGIRLQKWGFKNSDCRMCWSVHNGKPKQNEIERAIKQKEEDFWRIMETFHAKVNLAQT